MTQPAMRSDYLETKVLTASGPKLHLMLIEGAIRFVRQSQADFEANNEGHANQALLRAIDVVAELDAGVRHNDSEVNRKLADLYFYLFRTLVGVYANARYEELATVARILDFQRETWQLACQKLAETGPAPLVVPAPHAGLSANLEGFSVEA